MSATKKPSEDLQNMYMQLQMIEQQIAQIQEQLAQVETKKQEVSAMAEGLEDLGKVNKGTPSFAPIGLGIYSESKIANPKEALLNVGANVFVKKDLKEIKKLLKQQGEQFEEVEKTLLQNFQVLNIQAQMIQEQMQKSLGMGN